MVSGKEYPSESPRLFCSQALEHQRRQDFAEKTISWFYERLWI